MHERRHFAISLKLFLFSLLCFEQTSFNHHHLRILHVFLFSGSNSQLFVTVDGRRWLNHPRSERENEREAEDERERIKAQRNFLLKKYRFPWNTLEEREKTWKTNFLLAHYDVFPFFLSKAFIGQWRSECWSRFGEIWRCRLSEAQIGGFPVNVCGILIRFFNWDFIYSLWIFIIPLSPSHQHISPCRLKFHRKIYHATLHSVEQDKESIDLSDKR